MGQYKEAVEKQRLLLEAEKWSRQISDIHIHSLSSMWYDNRPQDTENGKSVTDISYNDGTIKRTLDSGEIVTFGTKLTGEALISEYTKRFSPTALNANDR